MRVWPLKDTGGVMDIKRNEALIAEIEQFKEEALKMHIVQVLADTYTNTNLFDHNINADGSVIWFKTQARQLWSFWQAAKAQVSEGYVVVPMEPTEQILNRMTNAPIEVNHLCDNADIFLSEDEARIAYKAMIEAQEPAPLKLGDLVKPIDHRYTLASGCERYPYAYVVNTNPFQLMSEEGDMYWCCTVEAGGYKLIKSNDQLPEAVSLRMIREGLLSPVETQEQSHD
jgi:hypothetical protein